MQEQETVDLIITSAVVINGEIIKKDSDVTLPKKLARDLVRRGKAKLHEVDTIDFQEELSLLDMSDNELAKIADDLGIKNIKAKSRDDIIALIEKAQAAE